MEAYVSDIERNGFAIIPAVIDSESVSRIIKEVQDVHLNEAIRHKGASTFGIRNLLNSVPATRELACCEAVRSIVDPIVGRGARVVRGIFFDKTPEANWKVAWHQDLTITIHERVEVEGFGQWTLKAGVLHAQPPTQILNNMLTLRIHLDDTDASNGALSVIPGSHKDGRLSHDDIQRLRKEVAPVTCSVLKGGVLAMRPLLLHSSPSSPLPRHRRVLHLEFSQDALPGGLEWYGS